VSTFSLKFAELCHGRSPELFNKAGFPEPIRKQMRLYVPAARTLSLSVSCPLRSPPILDIRDEQEKAKRKPAEDEEKREAEEEEMDVEDSTGKGKKDEDKSVLDRESDDDDSNQDGNRTSVDDLLNSEDEDEDDEDRFKDSKENRCDDTTVQANTSLHDDNYNDVAYEDNDGGEWVEPHRIWANSCTYSCQACKKFLTNSQSYFIRHLKKHHADLPSLVPYKRVHGEPFAAVRQTRCELCGTTLLQDHEKIRSHLRTRHQNLSVHKYYENFVLKAAEKEEDKQLEQKGTGEDSVDSFSAALFSLESDDEEEEDERVDANREAESGLFDEEEREFNKYKDWVNKCQIRYKLSSFLSVWWKSLH